MQMPGPMELVLILIIVMVLFGAKRLPEIGESLGKGINSFKNAFNQNTKDEIAVRNELGSNKTEQDNKL